MSVINKETVFGSGTLIPIVWVGAILVTLVGGIVWLTEIRSIAMANAIAVGKLEQSSAASDAQIISYRSRLFDRINDSDQRLSRIEGKLDILLSNKGVK